MKDKKLIAFFILAAIGIAFVIGWKIGHIQAIKSAKLEGSYGNSYEISFDGEKHYYEGI